MGSLAALQNTSSVVFGDPLECKETLHIISFEFGFHYLVFFSFFLFMYNNAPFHAIHPLYHQYIENSLNCFSTYVCICISGVSTLHRIHHLFLILVKQFIECNVNITVKVAVL